MAQDNRSYLPLNLRALKDRATSHYLERREFGLTAKHDFAVLIEIAEAAQPFAKDGGVTLTDLQFEAARERLRVAFDTTDKGKSNQ
jgi:hypothetical protein